MTLVQVLSPTTCAQIIGTLHCRDKEKMDKIVHSLGLKISARDLSHSDKRITLLAICSRWLPIAPAVLGIIAHYQLVRLMLIDYFRHGGGKIT